MSTQTPPKKKPLVNLPFPRNHAWQHAAEEVLEALRPRPQRYADRTWMPPRGTRRSMGKR